MKMKTLSVKPRVQEVALSTQKEVMCPSLSSLKARSVQLQTRAVTRLEIVAKQNSLRRQKVEERNRQYNRARKSAVGTRSRKV